jgi:hypothetical protein
LNIVEPRLPLLLLLLLLLLHFMYSKMCDISMDVLQSWHIAMLLLMSDRNDSGGSTAIDQTTIAMIVSVG